MNAAERAFLLALSDESQAATVALRKEVEKLQGAAIELRDHDVNSAWSKIEKAADRIVEKSHKPLSQAQAIDRVLREQPELYSAYLDAHDGRHESIEKARNATAQRQLAETAEEQLATLVAKYVSAGMDGDAAVDAVLQRRPDLVKACGADLPQVVEKGSGALAAIEREAQREMTRDRTVTHATAVARALARNPQLYSDYLAEVNGDNTPDDEAADEPWPPTIGSTASKSPLDGLKPRQRAAKAAVAPRDDPRAALRANTSQAEAQLVRIVQKTVQAGMGWDDAVDFAISARPDLVAAVGATGEPEN